VEREIAAARAPARHHLPFGRVVGHGEALGLFSSPFLVSFFLSDTAGRECFWMACVVSHI